MSGWQTSINKDLKVLQARCYDAITSRDALATRAAAVEEYYQTADTISTGIGALAVDGNIGAAAYQSRLDAAKKAVGELEAIDAAGDSSIAMKTTAVTVVKKIEIAWTALTKANAQENRDAYEKAVKELNDSYKELDDISKAAASAYVQVTEKLTAIE